jgi:hypothetical protein
VSDMLSNDVEVRILGLERTLRHVTHI